MKITQTVLLILLSAPLLIQFSSGAKILSINFISSKSHFIVYSPLLYGLADRGHEVTIFTPDPPGEARKNVRHIQVYDTKAVANKTLNLYTQREQTGNVWKYLNCNFWSFLSYVEAGCRRGFEHPFTNELLKENFDLVILTPLYNECLYGLLHKMNVSVVLFNQVSILPWQAESFGAPTLPAFSPLLYYGFSDQMNFVERVINFLGMVYFEGVLEFYYNPAMERLYREYVDAKAPPLKEIERNSSLILANSHIAFVPPRPMMPDIIEVGGLHLRPPNSLPKVCQISIKKVPKVHNFNDSVFLRQELQEFCDSTGKEGFILFSMGSFLQGSSMPEKYRQIFLNTFAKLKQKVLWKWETESMEDLPPNVRLIKWLPQQDVLSHKNIRMFITHGGHGGVTEGLYAGVPLLGIPMFSDQFWNMEQAERKGFGISLPFNELSEERLVQAVNQILGDKR